jgi:hypothetical protein
MGGGGVRARGHEMDRGGRKYATRRKGWGGDIGPGMAGARMRGGIRYREVACGSAEGEKMCYQVGPAQLDCYFFFFEFFQTGWCLFCFKSGLPEL